MEAQAVGTSLVVNTKVQIRQYVLAKKGTLADGSPGIEHEVLRLKPGANRVDAKFWKALAKEVEPDVAKAVIYELDKPFGQLSIRDQLELAKTTIDLELLKLFLKATPAKNEEVRKALKKQIDGVQKRARPRQEEEDA